MLILRIGALLNWGVDDSTLRRSAMDGPDVLGVGGAGREVTLAGEGALWARKAGDLGPVPTRLEALLEEVDVTDGEPEVVMGLGFRSGGPLAYMNLPARGSEAGADRGGEKVAGEAVAGLGLGGKLVPLA